jgi:hypothetical protein
MTDGICAGVTPSFLPLSSLYSSLEKEKIKDKVLEINGIGGGSAWVLLPIAHCNRGIHVKCVFLLGGKEDISALFFCGISV